MQPLDTELLCDFADVLQGVGKIPEAISVYQNALKLNPQLPRAWYSVGVAENASQEYVPAIASFQTAVTLRPGWLEARHNLARALYEMGQVSSAFSHFQQCAAADHEGSTQARAMIAVIIPGVPEADNAAVLRARKAWVEQDLVSHPPDRNRAGRIRASHHPLRVGYVSSFFHRDNWMKPVWGLINQHDRRGFQVHLFSDAPAASIHHGYRPHRDDRFFDTNSLSNDRIAALIEDCEIDVLVDLNGYSNMRRLPLFTVRPAPVILGWFNMYATTGMSSFDYLIGDEHVITQEEEQFYSEKIIRVSGSYLTFDVSYPVPPVSDAPCLRNGSITFGSLASQYKITDQVVESWSRILQQCPTTSLLLKNKQMASATSREFLHKLFSVRGISPERIRLEGPEDHFEFLKAYDRIDVALDTYPYNGGTTTTEAIWQGVPVVTFHGDRWASRTSARFYGPAASESS